MTKVSLDELLKAGAHFGHQKRRWNPKMRDYIHGVVSGVHVFDLVKTKELLEEALKAVENAVKEGKRVVVLGSKKQAKERVALMGANSGVFTVTERWLGGAITNFEQISKSIRKLHDMREKREAGQYNKYTKKERLLLDREIERLERFFGGIEDLKEPPEMLIVVDVKREFAAVREANMAGVTVVGIVDTNADPTGVDFVIPMNDDATKALEYVLGLVEAAIMKGKKHAAKKTAGKADRDKNIEKKTAKMKEKLVKGKR